MKKQHPFFNTLLAEIAGSFLTSAGLYNFAVASDFPMTGFSGIALIIYRLTGIPIGLATILLNVPVAIITAWILGKRFLFRSIRCMIIQSLMIDYLMPLFPSYTGERIVAALFTGALSGIGYGIIYRAGSSTGGMDFITLTIKAKKPHLSLGGLSFAFEFLVVFSGGLIFHDYDGIMYGLLINYILASTVDKIMFGANAGKLLMIVSDDGPKVSTLINDVSERGSTIVKASGGYKQDERDVVICACSTKEVYPIQQIIKKEVPSAFTIILDSSEVHGEGFKYTSIGHN